MSALRLSRRDFLRGRSGALSSAGLDRPPHSTTGVFDFGSRDGRALIAQLEPARCLGSVSQVCTVCAERCAARGAIRMNGLLPIIDPLRCTGCSACANACPAPLSALRMVRRL